MPIYEVFHIIPLTMEQHDKLADGLTKLHSETFTTPRLFVNVVFHDYAEKHTYVSGKRRAINRIVATVRSGPSRTQDQYGNLCAEIEKLWNSIVGELENHPRKELRAIFVLGSIIAGAEAGFIIPQAGDDRNWIERNMSAFKEKADGGDEDFVDLLTDVKHRKGFEGLVGDWKSEQEIKEEKEEKKHEKDDAEGGEEVPERPKQEEKKE